MQASARARAGGRSARVVLWPLATRRRWRRRRRRRRRRRMVAHLSRASGGGGDDDGGGGDDGSGGDDGDDDDNDEDDDCSERQPSGQSTRLNQRRCGSSWSARLRQLRRSLVLVARISAQTRQQQGRARLSSFAIRGVFA